MTAVGGGGGGSGVVVEVVVDEEGLRHRKRRPEQFGSSWSQCRIAWSLPVAWWVVLRTSASLLLARCDSCCSDSKETRPRAGGWEIKVDAHPAAAQGLADRGRRWDTAPR